MDEALAEFRSALAVNPDDAELHNIIAAALLEQGAPHEALESCSRAVALNPDYAEAYVNLGNVLVHLGRFNEGIAQYRRAIAIKSDFADAYINLGMALLDIGNKAEAIAQTETAASLSGSRAFPHYSMGVLLAKCDLRNAARTHFDAYLAHDRNDRKGARLFLAGLGFEPMPERTSEAYLDRLYAARATCWDRHATTSNYCAIDLVAAAFDGVTDRSGKLDILDAGCGTGLVGLRVRNRAHRLDGVDLAAAMLDKARAKNVYDRLHQGDLVAFSLAHPMRYDAIICAASLIHFSDLFPALHAASIALRDTGLFIFTLFSNDNERDGQEITVAAIDGRAGCFAHGPRYVARVAQATGFVVERMDRRVHEYNRSKPIMGLIGVLRRQSRGELLE